MIVRRAQERAHSLKTGLPFMDSARPATKHSSALFGSPVNRNDSRYILLISSVKIRSRSEAVAYASEFRILPLSARFILIQYLGSSAVPHQVANSHGPLSFRCGALTIGSESWPMWKS